MDLVLAGLQWSSCLVYLDDVIVVGRNFDEHLKNLQAVLQRLRETGLKLQPAKCALLQSKVCYLGHIISENGVSTDPAKTDTVQKWPTPTSPRRVSRVPWISQLLSEIYSQLCYHSQTSTPSDR